MARSNDYPRMLFHRMEDPVTVHSREEEEKLGAEWARTIWQPELIPQPDPAPYSEDQDHEANGEASAFEPTPKHHKSTKKRR